MKEGLTQITVVLDRSGSMQSCAKETIDNFNEFVSQQRQEPGEANLRLVQFNNHYQFVYDEPLTAVEPLNTTTFQPSGTTALRDAIGKTIDELGGKLSVTPEAERPSKVIVLILTDGEENSSRFYTQERVASMVEHQRLKYKWEFVFMGASQNDILVAKKLNIPIHSTFVGAISDPRAIRQMSNYTSTYRKSSTPS